MRGKMAAAAALILLAMAMVPAIQSEASAATDVLIDDGDGNIQWTEGSGGSAFDIVSGAASGIGRSVSIDGGVITVDGRTSAEIGSASTGGSLSQAGDTGVRSVSSWHLFGWDGMWRPISASDPGYSALALMFGPDGTVPVATPEHRQPWTMFRGDSGNTGNASADAPVGEGTEVAWSDKGAAYANALYAGGYIFQKFGVYAYGEDKGYAKLSCIDAATGEHVWDFRFLSGANYENSTPLIVGDSIYVATMGGHIYKMPWRTGPGEDYRDVTSVNGTGYSDAEKAPSYITDFDEGTTYGAAFSSLVYDSGVILAAHCNGMLYCFDTDLNLIWSYMMGGCSYFVAPTVKDGLVFQGALNGHLYVLDLKDGSAVTDEAVFQVHVRDKTYGGLGQIAVFGDGPYTLMFTVTDGLGMGQSVSGIAVFGYDPGSGTLVKKLLDTSLGSFGRFVSPVGGYAYATVSDGVSSSLLRIDTDGSVTRFTEGLAEIHSAGVAVNGEVLYLTSYSSSDPLYAVSLRDGSVVGATKCSPDVRNFNMSSVLVAGGFILGATDSGIYRMDGGFAPYSPPSSEKGAPVIVYIAAMVAAVIAVLAAIWAVLKFGKKEDRPFAYLKERFVHYLYGEDLTHNARNRHRLRFVLIVGALLVFIAFTLCISIGSTSAMNPLDAYSALFSAISKGGAGLDQAETAVFVSRLPRTIAALAVGIGLAVAGSVYQAIIRNPLVDPYIMGVSSGAGVAAVAVIAFDFTFFGVFSPHSVFLTAIAAAVGGLAAFVCTMVIAERAGGSSINYVLAGVVVGLAFSAVQTIMLTMAGNKLGSTLSWLYGSFAEVTWSQVGVVLSLSVFLSAVPMLWAKEFNLVLLGDDQAREMGLDVKKFDRLMLVLASVLTSVCVAFCGVIGFVGLVVPHLCRMLLGSDHRMVLPASVCFGAAMLMLADLLSRTGYYGMELPVGAITTIIGIPVFAYLLIKKGRMYDGRRPAFGTPRSGEDV